MKNKLLAHSLSYLGFFLRSPSFFLWLTKYLWNHCSSLIYVQPVFSVSNL
jgi:hypothetical protein